MTRKLATALLLLLLGPLTAYAQIETRPTRTITDADIPDGARVTFSADSVYILSGIVFIHDGAELHIEAGTVVKAESGTDADATALVVTRSGKLFAEGTAADPIRFTSVEDNLDGPDALTYQSRGKWGGIVLLGRARTNNRAVEAGPDDLETVEGLNEIFPDDDRIRYGGEDDAHSSGVMTYVSIRYTGINVGQDTGNEIQGLTLGGVGSGTVLDYIESFASGDDGFEFFGGTVEAKHLVSAFNADDAFDWDEGFRGKGQFWFALQGTDAAGALAEQDGAGGTYNETSEPYAVPVIYNATYIGAGVGATPESDRAQALMFRDNTGGKYYNSIVYDFETAEGGLGLTVENLDTAGGGPVQDSQARLEAGDLVLANNIWYGFGAGNTLAAFVDDDDGNRQAVIDHLTANNNVVADPLISGVDRSIAGGTGGLDPRPMAESPAFTAARASYPDDDFFEEVDYLGAFGEQNWLLGWTALDELGYLGDLSDVAVEQISEEMPERIALSQNYPNPFNPTTNIAYRLDRSQQVRLAVYDLLGREVAVLIDGVQAAGTYRVPFDAHDLASGVYLYRLRTRHGIYTRTMTLAK